MEGKNKIDAPIKQIELMPQDQTLAPIDKRIKELSTELTKLKRIRRKLLSKEVRISPQDIARRFHLSNNCYGGRNKGA